MNRAARGHSTDVLTNETFFKENPGHDDVNGTTAAERITKFSPAWSAEGFLPVAPGSGLYRGFSSIVTWICDAPFFSNGSFVRMTNCSNDQGTDGNRGNFLTKSRQFGFGVDGIGHPLHNKTGSFTVTFVFWNERTEKYADKHIASASHVGDPLAEGNFMYIATLFTKGITVSSVTVTELLPGSTKTIILQLNPCIRGRMVQYTEVPHIQHYLLVILIIFSSDTEKPRKDIRRVDTFIHMECHVLLIGIQILFSALLEIVVTHPLESSCHPM